MIDLETLNCSLFTPLIGQEIRLEGLDGTSFTAILKKAEEEPRSMRRGAPRVPFSLTLGAPLPCEHGHGDYVLNHPALAGMPPVRVVRTISGDYTPMDAPFQIIFN